MMQELVEAMGGPVGTARQIVHNVLVAEIE